jgi:CDP-diacylglycerol---glycerol-3-phosphate 3-phosphatidyltransferase
MPTDPEKRLPTPFVRKADGARRIGPRFRSLSLILPNVLSFARLAMGLAFPWTPSGWRLGVVIAAAVSDLVDGAISRLMRASSTAGQIIDPMADKVFALSVLGTLLFEDRLQLWQALLVAARDLSVIAGTVWVCIRHGLNATKTMPPTWLGKVTTAMQFLFILAVLHLQSVAWFVLVPTALCSLAAGIDYIRRYQYVQR